MSLTMYDNAVPIDHITIAYGIVSALLCMFLDVDEANWLEITGTCTSDLETVVASGVVSRKVPMIKSLM